MSLFPVRSSVSTVRKSLTVQRIHSNSVFAKPFLESAARTSWSVKTVPVVPLGRFIQFDAVILDGSGLELFGHAPFHIARGLPNLEEALHVPRQQWSRRKCGDEHPA